MKKLIFILVIKIAFINISIAQQPDFLELLDKYYHFDIVPDSISKELYKYAVDKCDNCYLICGHDLTRSGKLICKFQYHFYEGMLEIKTRNILDFDINKYDSLFFENEYVGELINKDTLLKYYYNPEDSNDKPEKKMENIPYYGYIPIPKGAIMITSEMSPSDLEIKTSWEFLFYILRQTEAIFIDYYNRESISKFSTKFEELSNSKQMAILEIYRLNIIFRFNYDINWDGYIPPPPLPDDPKIDEFVIDSFDIQEDELKLDY